MKKLKQVLISSIIVLVVNCCSKSEVESPTPKLLLDKDPSVHESFGLKINFDDYGYPKFYGNAWGSSDQFFISAEKDILRVDLVSNSLSNIAPNSGGIVTGLSGDKEKMIFVGDYNNGYGYYGYPIAAPDTAIPLISLNKNEATRLIVYENHLLLGTGEVVTTGRPCTSIGDFWCGVSQGVANYTLYHVDAVTKAATAIGPGHNPILFSANGQKSLISGNGKFYEYDLNLRQKTDSFPISGEGLIFWGNPGPQSLRTDINGDVVITSLDNGTEIDRFQTSALITSVLWGPNGRRIYYTGFCRSGGCTYAVWSFDLNTREEKRHVLTMDTTPLTSPFEEIQVSPDDRNIVFRHINGLYLKRL